MHFHNVTAHTQILYLTLRTIHCVWRTEHKITIYNYTYLYIHNKNTMFFKMHNFFDFCLFEKQYYFKYNFHKYFFKNILFLLTKVHN